VVVVDGVAVFEVDAPLLAAGDVPCAIAAPIGAAIKVAASSKERDFEIIVGSFQTNRQNILGGDGESTHRSAFRSAASRSCLGPGSQKGPSALQRQSGR
jgi:hypothetical protein